MGYDPSNASLTLTSSKHHLRFMELTVAATHPVQYHAPVWRALQSDRGIQTRVVYGSDFSIQGYHDEEFGKSFTWDTDLTSGYHHQVIRKVQEGGAKNYAQLTGAGVMKTLDVVRPHCLLVLGYTHPFDRTVLRWARKNNVPTLLRAETNDTASPRSFLKKVVRTLYLKKLYSRIHGFCYIGKESKAHYTRHGVRDNQLFFSPYCVDPTFFIPDGATEAKSSGQLVRAKFGIPQDAVVLLYSGKLSPRKGVDLIPAAIKKLPAKLRDQIHLLFLGDGELMKEVVASCDGLNASFAGFQNQSQLSPFYHAANALLFPSRHGETWGLVVNEALHHSLYCLVSDSVGCHTDLVIPDHTGSTFEAGNLTALAEAISNFMARPSLLPNSAVIQDLIHSYSIENAVAGIEQCLSHLNCD